jgi:FkbM family methyltransferase
MSGLEREPSVKIYPSRSGPMLVLRGDQYIGQAIATYGEYCDEEAQVFRRLIKPGMTVVEVGANMGSHSVDMARACAPGAFYAFEPQPRLFQILCANLAMNDIGNALAYPDALGEAEGEAMVPPVNYLTTGNFGGIELVENNERGIKVRVRTLDDFELKALHVLKVDVEGFEAAVIRGARETIRRCNPVIYIENDRQAKQQELISLIAELGYTLYWHAPRLFNPNNHNGIKENIYGGTVSLNMLCLPRETRIVVEGLPQIDPENWSSPVQLAR